MSWSDRLNKTLLTHGAMEMTTHYGEVLANLNVRISSVSAELSRLLARRDEIYNIADTEIDNCQHIVDMIEIASRGDHIHRLHVAEGLDTLRYHCDLTHWPTVSSFVDAIGLNATQGASNAPLRTVQVSTAI